MTEKQNKTPVSVLDTVVQRISSVRDFIPIIYLISENRDILEELFLRQDCFEIFRKDQEGHWIAAQYQSGSDGFNVEEYSSPSKFTSTGTGLKNYHPVSLPKVPAIEEPETRYYFRKDFNLLEPEDQQKYIVNYVNHVSYEEVLHENLLLVSPIGPQQVIPNGFEQYVEIIDVPLIGLWEFSALAVKYQNLQLSKLNRPHISLQEYLREPDDYLYCFKGLNQKQVQYILLKVIAKFGWVTSYGLLEKERQKFDKQKVLQYVKKITAEQKKQSILKDGTINFESTENAFKPGGMDGLFQWIEEKKQILDNPKRAKIYGESFPRGILIAGLPGSGKSLTAKYIAKAFGDIPLIRFSLQKVMTGIVGGTEEKLDRALKLIEASAPCVVWIDELEKEMAGTSRGESDGGVASRCLARLLNWMQESQEHCFICATANNIDTLPSEFLRRGRFDKKYYTFLPMQEQCEAIMCCHLIKIANECPNYFEKDIDLQSLARETFDYIANYDGYFYSGADIEGLVEDVKSRIFKENITLPINYNTFRSYVFECVGTSTPYGLTNFQDVLNYWLKLKKHMFLNAATAETRNKNKPVELFSFTDLHFNGGKWEWRKDMNTSFSSEYDKNMYKKLKEGILLMANHTKA